MRQRLLVQVKGEQQLHVEKQFVALRLAEAEAVSGTARLHRVGRQPEPLGQEAAQLPINPVSHVEKGVVYAGQSYFQPAAAAGRFKPNCENHAANCPHWPLAAGPRRQVEAGS